MTAPQMALFERPAMLRDKAAPLVSVPTAGAMTPRDYQLRADAAIDEALSKHRSTLTVMATGTGKTVLFAMQAKKRGGALVIAHENSLIQQAAQKLRHVTGEYVAIEKAERRDRANSRFVVGSMQTLRGDRLRYFADTHPWIEFIVIDEAHRALAKSYRDIMAAFPNAKVLGVTATADRGDKKAMGLVFDSVAYRYDIVDATADGWLTPVEWIPVDVSGVSLDDIGLKGGDLDQDELDDATSGQAAQLAKTIHEHCAGMQTIGFAPGVKTAVVTAEALNDPNVAPGSARSIHGEMADFDKDAIKAGHSRAEFPYLLNCAILIEGYDDPRLRCIVDIAKTKSRARFAQKLGRGTRLWPTGIDHLATPEERRAAIAASPKPFLKFFDCNYGQHGHTLAGPVDLLGGRYDDEVKKRAKDMLEANGGGDVADALEVAAAEIEAAKQRKLKAAAARAAKAKGQVLVGAARAACELFGVSTDMGEEDEQRGEPIANVKAWLETKGVKNAATMPDSAARNLKRTLQERQKHGFATWKMVRALKKAGVDKAEALLFDQARKLIVIASAHWDRGDWGFKFTAAELEAALQ